MIFFFRHQNFVCRSAGIPFEEASRRSKRACAAIRPAGLRVRITIAGAPLQSRASDPAARASRTASRPVTVGGGCAAVAFVVREGARPEVRISKRRSVLSP